MYAPLLMWTLRLYSSASLQATALAAAAAAAAAVDAYTGSDSVFVVGARWPPWRRSPDFVVANDDEDDDVE